MAKDGSCGSLAEEVRSWRWSVRTVIPDSGGISVRCRSRLLLTVHRTTNCFLGTSLYFLAESLSLLSRVDGNVPMLWSMETAVGSDSQSGYNGFLDYLSKENFRLENLRRGGGGFVYIHIYMNPRPTQGMRASSFRTNGLYYYSKNVKD